MLQVFPILTLVAAVADGSSAATASVSETAAKIVASGDPSSSPGTAPSSNFTIRHEDGKTTLTMEDAEIVLSNRVQFRFTDEIPAGNVRLPGTTGDGQSKPSFRIRRAKTSIEGWFWKKELTFEVQLSWAGPEAGASTLTPLEDARLTWDASKKGSFMITIGQFKVPLGRQELTSSGKLQFADRSLLSGEFTRGRDVGIQAHGRVSNNKVEYFAGIFNGNSASRTSNDNTKLQYNARVSIEPLGKVSYSETAFEGWEKPLFAIAAQFENNDLSGATNLTDFNTTVFGGDAVYKYKGFSLFAEYFNRKRKPEARSGTSSANSGQATQSSGSFNSNGYNLEAGYFLKKDKAQVALRFAGYDPSDKVPSNNRRETGGVFNYFILKHTLKVVMDFRGIRDDLSKETNKELRVQAQFIF